MIYTVTCNPCLDYVMRVDAFAPGAVNRTAYEELRCGGKGINVSIILNRLSCRTMALGFTAGFTGELLQKELEAEGVCTDFIRIKTGMTRINITLEADSETEINARGPAISDADIALLLKQLERVQDSDIVVLAGSVPPSVPENIYGKIIRYCRRLGKRPLFAVDAEKSLLTNALQERPFLIKPNIHELGALFSVTVSSDREMERCARLLQEQGAQHVLVSHGKDGAVLFSPDGGVFRCAAPRGKVINTVGSGDSMVAGFLYGYESSKDFETALRYGVAAGSASAFSPGLAGREAIETLAEQLNHSQS